MYLVPAYDYSGNRRPLHRLAEGDLIEWKRNGSRGFKAGRVTCIVPEKKQPIRVMPYTSPDGGYSGERERWIGRDRVMRVYEQDGRTRRQPRPEDQNTASTANVGETKE